uniref:BolA-like protein n=2 Tax=Phaeomonas parva TaxID=124430 RepID=A0A7S1XYY2_9STRA|mmetsp:Transcript_45969/g.143853  ORF Transcript_45969/g.143853 Transcript_45969/m.143853 type:complete len:121 (+) Transcript_45969:222-584(+)
MATTGEEAAAGAEAGPVQQAIEAKLTEALTPSFMQVLNESSGHNVPPGSESHFKVVVVSQQFDGVGLLQRHRLVNHALAEELDGAIHALSIVAKTPAQWEKAGGMDSVAASPACRGGSGK